jgi:hypothetical protein
LSVYFQSGDIVKQLGQNGAIMLITLPVQWYLQDSGAENMRCSALEVDVVRHS